MNMPPLKAFFVFLTIVVVVANFSFAAFSLITGFIPMLNTILLFFLGGLLTVGISAVRK